MSNGKFVLTFASLLMFFVALTFGIYFLAGIMSADVNSKLSEQAQEIVKDHAKAVTQPAASFAVGDASQMVAAVASGPVDIGEQVYKNVCTSCHAAGVAGAPVTGDETAWGSRIAKGLDVLYASAINGLGIMPAKGGSPTATDEDIQAAVNYMVRRVDPSAAPAPEGAAEAVEVEAAAVDTASAEVMADAATETVAVVASADLSAEGEALYNTACMACHAAGVAGAPILGDKEAWTSHIAKGIDALYASAINGIGIMPPKGGSSAEDDVVKAAVDYMVSKSQ